MENGNELVLILFLMSIMVIWAGVLTKRGISSYRWPKAKGIVVLSEVQKTWAHSGHIWIPRVVYKYEYEGKEYESKNIYFKSQAYTRPITAEKFISKYPIGSEHIVYVKPANPTISVLVPGLKFLPMFMLISGIIIIILVIREFILYGTYT